MNRCAKEYAAGFRSDRIVVLPRGLDKGDWLTGMAAMRQKFLRARREWPQHTRMSTTEYGWCRGNAMQPVLAKLAQAERRIEANAFAKKQIAANPTQPFDMHAYAARLFGFAA